MDCLLPLSATSFGQVPRVIDRCHGLVYNNSTWPSFRYSLGELDSVWVTRDPTVFVHSQLRTGMKLMGLVYFSINAEAGPPKPVVKVS